MKNTLYRQLAVLLLCNSVLFGQSTSATRAVDVDSLDGSWEGDLVFVQGATLSNRGPATGRYRITIQGSTVHVYVVHPEDVKEVKPGTFRMERVMTNAVIYATDSGNDDEGTWVETWVFAVTLENETTLLTNFARVVNNIDLPLSNDHSKFAHEAAGELKRIGGTTLNQDNPPPTEQKSESPATSSDQKQQTPSSPSPMSPATGETVGSIEILSDTMGVNFGPYLNRVLHDVRLNWYNLIPEVARPPIMKKGKVTIEFAITKDGRVAGMKLAATSGDVALDRSAWGAITNSSPFRPLPKEFGGRYLALRFSFLYNPDKSGIERPTPFSLNSPFRSGPLSISPSEGVEVPVGSSRQFSATVNAPGDKEVIWSVSGSGCTAAACGTISSSGLYTAPPNVPYPASVRVMATLAADPGKTASAKVTIQSNPSR